MKTVEAAATVEAVVGTAIRAGETTAKAVAATLRSSQGGSSKSRWSNSGLEPFPGSSRRGRGGMVAAAGSRQDLGYDAVGIGAGLEVDHEQQAAAGEY